MIAKSIENDANDKNLRFCFPFYALLPTHAIIYNKKIPARHIGQNERSNIVIRSVPTFRSESISLSMFFSEAEFCRMIKHEREPE